MTVKGALMADMNIDECHMIHVPDWLLPGLSLQNDYLVFSKILTAAATRFLVDTYYNEVFKLK